MNKNTLVPAVVMGLSPTGLHVVRALGKEGVQVTGVEDGRQAGRHSRYLTNCIRPSNDIEKLDMLCSLFSDYPDANGRLPVLIPTSDQDVDFIIQHSESLGKLYSYQDSYKDGVAAGILNKNDFYETCINNDIDIPSLWSGLKSDIPSLKDSFVYPIMIKPSLIHEIKKQMGGKKGWIVQSEQQLGQVVNKIPENAGVLLFQQIIPGPESEISLCCAHVHRSEGFQQTFTARKLRQFPPGFGSASLVQSDPQADAEEITKKLLVKLGYNGIAASEFKYNCEDGKLYLIEINVRPSLWFSITSESDKPVVLSAYLELACISDLLKSNPQVNRVRWRYGIKDLYSLIFYKFKKDFILQPPEIEKYAQPVRKTAPVFELRDPLPFITDLTNFVLKALNRTIGLGR